VSIDPRLNSTHESVVVDCSPEDAFAYFTTRMGEWWPLDKGVVRRR
jgi:hypothetical protein